MIILHSCAPCKDTLAAWFPKASLKRSCLENERIRNKMPMRVLNAAAWQYCGPKGAGGGGGGY